MRPYEDPPPLPGPGREFELIDRIARVLGPSRAPEVTLGIGDDAAVLDPARLRPGEQLVWTVDASVEGVHFRPELLSWEDVGFRATVAAASDLLAKGARPVAALAGLTIPAARMRDDLASIEAIARGQRQACEALGMSLVGGNIAEAESLSITTTALGAATRVVTRAGARPGDLLVVAGPLGESALGLAWLMRGRPEEHAPRLVTAFRRPPVLLAASGALAVVARAMVDVSDGLAQDVGHLARASGVRARIDLARIAAARSEEAAEVARMLRVEVADHELAGGEDYALAAAIPEGAALPEGASVIGVFEEGQGVVVVEESGAARHAPAGWSHGG
jgi:thiamine-monophosphate kinase